MRVCVNICIKKMKIERGVIHDGSFQISPPFKTLHAGCIFKSKFGNFKNNIMINKYYFKMIIASLLAKPILKINFYVILKRPTGHLSCVS